VLGADELGTAASVDVYVGDAARPRQGIGGCMEFRVQGLEFRVRVSRFRVWVWGLRFWVWGSEVSGLRSRVKGVGFRVEGFVDPHQGP
jgi:hypothetical protein